MKAGHVNVRSVIHNVRKYYESSVANDTCIDNNVKGVLSITVTFAR